jgi:hypothetical protein
MSNIRDFELDQGKSKTIVFSMGTEAGLGMNLAGSDARIQARRTYGAKADINATLMNGQLVWANAVQGKLEWRIADVDTKNIKFDNKDDAVLELVYELEITLPNGKVEGPARGTLILNREVVR